eukprot:TRINITY_DN1385_c0_g3_i1.p1 TRINITY_DN1385_c0_g3~~TRINITY_DN1385_c0_g3_i1.p1  ORF type:complete len:139 (+),score=22.85 TRINITY_DN1385_c0_g3_i1:152-568(+)
MELELSKAFNQLEVDEDWVPTEDYYVHLDVVDAGTMNNQTLANRMNSFMLKKDSYDPRKSRGFSSDLHDPNDGTLTLKKRRELLGVGKEYYELWRVRKDFPVDDFADLIHNQIEGVVVRITRIVDNDHEIEVLYGQQQ